ncbi:MAG: hypothetical protein Q4F53_04605 [Nesterenkonia sp.]|uniref:hypothetical protein n=1 Tax=Nesterenkonia marinintestina TaxID=2979865 RepID=UPI0021C134E3|nr:hypothetical protein [Nesterenkonia sp. GX14115]MDO5492872.1 hypothetical protein [Nesterenkonia sp.]
MSPRRPGHPVLARRFDRALRQGAQIRYADDARVVAWYPPRPLGCLGLAVLSALAVLTYGVALVVWLLVAPRRRGTLLTWELRRSGRVRRTVRRGVS